MIKKYIEYDLWTIALFMMLIPNFIIESVNKFNEMIFVNLNISNNVSAVSNFSHPTIFAIALTIYIGLGIYLLIRCGLIVKYRYLRLYVNCKKEPKHYITISLIILFVFGIIVLLNMHIFYYIIPIFLYELVTISLSTKYYTKINKEV